jgi:DNA processing protein
VADVVDLLALCRIEGPGLSWPFIAREAQRPGGLNRLLAGSASETSPQAEMTLSLLQGAAATFKERHQWAAETIESARADGYQLTTVLDDDYPVNLRLIHNLPPFLFYLGELRPDDAYSVAVVGTRQPSEEGIRRARKISRMLAEARVTVLSGLARGIDTAAHEECVAAGGRTIAVLGSGIRRIYPDENGDLARRIVDQGAIVSQFWPDTGPMHYNFPRRNVVTSGLGQGTVVIEATRTSGAKMQARLAFEHGKLVFLLRSLVTSQPWARIYLRRPRVFEVDDVKDIVRRLRPAEEQRDRVQQQAQLALAL